MAKLNLYKKGHGPVEILEESVFNILGQKKWERSLFYSFIFLDPPYHHPMRNAKKLYGRREWTTEMHKVLLDQLAELGRDTMFMLCGYPSQLYLDYAKKYNWRSVTFPTVNHMQSGPTKRTEPETIWMNYYV